MHFYYLASSPILYINLFSQLPRIIHTHSHNYAFHPATFNLFESHIPVLEAAWYCVGGERLCYLGSVPRPTSIIMRGNRFSARKHRNKYSRSSTTLLPSEKNDSVLSVPTSPSLCLFLSLSPHDSHFPRKHQSYTPGGFSLSLLDILAVFLIMPPNQLGSRKLSFPFNYLVLAWKIETRISRNSYLRRPGWVLPSYTNSESGSCADQKTWRRGFIFIRAEHYL